MGFSVRIAPGVRVRVTPSGVRVRVTPSGVRVGAAAASTRVRVGAGGAGAGGVTASTTVPTLFGPLTVSSGPLAPAPTTRAGRRRGGGRRAPAPAAGRAAAAEAEKAREAELLAAELEALTSAHRSEVVPVPPSAAPPLSDPDAVVAALVEAYARAGEAAAPVGVDGEEVTTVLLAPPESVVPDRVPGRTAAGRASLRAAPARWRAGVHATAVTGQALRTARRALATVPALAAVRVVVVREAGPDAYGRPRLECLLAGRWTRAALDGVRWDLADAGVIAAQTASELLVQVRRGGLAPLDLRGEPALAALLDHVAGRDADG
ncbi:hypothetical protein [Quadrisphaera sp. DSM 44207]|uniref:hypothetical protein n=1 Tax=Quadrisphaera sp. DSM 44207 TaxID=1881057 RepID=UPI000881617D|nr:hypothetical protein [Quadrisphaera sp. DSM 44207]SDQ74341.1 hypothetical protein SAMN05428996_2632 [Quadrisphaera sp. DSM 44207]